MSSRSRGTALIDAISVLQRWSAALLMSGVPLSAMASQVDIVGPPGSGTFGYQVLALPNGNFAVSDSFMSDWTSSPGAVHLYSSKGTLISTLIGSDPGDQVGLQLKSLGNGNFVVISPNWNHYRGAVTFVNGTTGLSGTVSAGNSLVGSQEYDYVGSAFFDSFPSPIPLTSFAVVGTGNYVITSNHWDDGDKIDVGAVTWCSGATGCTGPVAATNSLIGGTPYDRIGQPGPTVLSNGNYVVVSNNWHNPLVAETGAITWASGSSGIAGLVSPQNSLVGNDGSAAYVVPLRNGNYVVGMPAWDNGAIVDAGAAVWGNGTSGVAGSVSSANAFVGSHNGDRVGYSITALSNGHYVVCTPYLDAGPLTDIGAATWANGDTGMTGTASALLSLVGPAGGKGPDHAIALTNGNYVVVSPGWDAGGATMLGAVTWANGSAATWGTVSSANSLVGSSENDHVGANVVALSNGNYVVGSPDWNGVEEGTGAATWANGSAGLVGTVSAANSLVGTSRFDGVGSSITALRNGHYVVVSSSWDKGNLIDVGAATWGNGNTGLVGTVSAANSLVGASMWDFVGACGATALSNGNYVVCSYTASLAGFHSGAVTWGDGSVGTVGTVSTNISLYGSHGNDLLGSSGISAMSDDSYVIGSTNWNAGLGAITLGSGTGKLVGPVGAANSVRGTTNRFGGMTFDYNAAQHQLIAGRPEGNIVSLFTLDTDGIFADGFDQ